MDLRKPNLRHGETVSYSTTLLTVRHHYFMCYSIKISTYTNQSLFSHNQQGEHNACNPAAPETEAGRRQALPSSAKKGGLK